MEAFFVTHACSHNPHPYSDHYGQRAPLRRVYPFSRPYRLHVIAYPSPDMSGNRHHTGCPSMRCRSPCLLPRARSSYDSPRVSSSRALFFAHEIVSRHRWDMQLHRVCHCTFGMDSRASQIGSPQRSFLPWFCKDKRLVRAGFNAQTAFCTFCQKRIFRMEPGGSGSMDKPSFRQESLPRQPSTPAAPSPSIHQV